MYRSNPYAYPGLVANPYAGSLGELPAGITQGSCDMARNAGTTAAQSLTPADQAFTSLLGQLPAGADPSLIDGVRTCFMEGYNAKKTEMEGSFYSSPKGQKGLVVGAIAGLLLGVVVGKVIL